MKKNIFIICFLLFIPFVTNAQELIRYLIEIPNIQYVPEKSLDKNSNNVLKINSKLKDADKINSIFQSYTIKGFYNYFKGTEKSTLKNRYVLDLAPEDDISILTKLFPTQYPSYEKEEVFETLSQEYNMPIAYTPNDFENPDLTDNIRISNYDEYEQNELKVIRAEEAWGITKGEPYVIIGVSDQGFDVAREIKGVIDPGHEDLASEFVGGLTDYEIQIDSHGNSVAGFASAATDNGLGISSIGFNTKMIGARGGSTSNLVALAQFDPKPKVLNFSYGNDNSSGGNQIIQDRLDLIRDLDVTVVIAAGNGPYSGSGSSSSYYYPASYKNVISVSSVGNKNEIGSTKIAYDNWKDVHKVYDHDEGIVSHQHNDSIDIVVPLYYPSPKAFKDVNHDDPYKDDYRRIGVGGTSYSAPIVAGTIGLMHSVNYCIKPNEVETILKLTAVVVDTIPQNLEFYGQLGAGRLDAYEAVKMAKDMADDYGVVQVKDRLLYRPWFYKLATAPYKINMNNNQITEDSKIKFRARNSIDITETLMEPSNGYIDLEIDPSLSLDCEIPSIITSTKKNGTNNTNTLDEIISDFKVFPTLLESNDNINVTKLSDVKEIIQIRIFDITGKLLLSKEKVSDNKTELDITNLNSGIYILNVYNLNQEILHTSKFVKK